MALHLSTNIIKLIYRNIDISKVTAYQNDIKSKCLLDSLVNVINHTLNKYSSMKYNTIISDISDVAYSIELLINGNIIIGSNDGILKVFDPSKNFKCIKELSMHQDSIYTVLVLKNGHIISRSWDMLLIWEPETFKYKSLQGHSGDIRAVIQLDNELIVSSAEDNNVKLWKEDICVKTLQVEFHIERLDLLSNDKFLGYSSGYVYIFDYDLKVITKLKHDSSGLPIVFETLDKRLVCCYNKQFIGLYDANYVMLSKVDIPEDYYHFIMLNDKDIISFYNSSIVVWDINKEFEKQVFKYDWDFKRIFPFLGCFFITTSNGFGCRLWYYHKRPITIKILEEFQREVICVRSIGDYLVTASFDKTCKVYKMN
jgi:WD40 repeat protein